MRNKATPGGGAVRLRRHVAPVLIGPVTMGVVIPALVWTGSGMRGVDVPLAVRVLCAGVGVALVLGGVAFLAWTVSLFHRKGEGTLSPLDPPRHLVVTGPYRHVRNPMISGVLAIQLGEAVALRSPWLGLWFGLFFLANAVYLPLSEERRLRDRFGDAYDRYRRHVPRWVPRVHAWDPAG
ncbi:isoprenylcysteine carboxylmethyltransferase family protein [Streptomyces sp. JJ38]|uniref:methyltransferase family protein n=1 Tax=Streptomyces sp. JJ38 TaxID=2738128 RepID=UPI001C58B6E6|nr:isoprenylcysteine carboxylmethyltransferase family protein [Streptomyces sp. JJ38]MBW1599256.1 isoprenylcysteine carboxylmethyltransferase family protein [Streptomyces sp. JJ38]